MRTIKIYLSIAGFLITSLCFGQLFSQNNSNVLYYSSYYDLASNRFEHYIKSFPDRTKAGDYFDAPALTRTYFVPIEYDIVVEPWMTKPFENSYYEEELQVESWMESPFENLYYEEDIEIESWMTRPFETVEETEEVIEGEIEIEEWMTTAWI